MSTPPVPPASVPPASDPTPTGPAPLVSIVIPAYNRARLIGGALQSCLLQSHQDFEIIIVDSARSTDDLAGVVARFADPRIRLHRDPVGTAAANRNHGVRLARGRFIAFLDSDDAFLADRLAEGLTCQRHTGAAVVYSQIYVDRGVGRLWAKPKRAIAAGEDIFDYLFVSRGLFHLSTMLVESALARRCPFHDDVLYGDDYQFAVDLRRSGARFAMVERPLAIYRDHGHADQLSQSPMLADAASPLNRGFIAWVDRERPQMSERAWLAYRAGFLARFCARSAPIEALRMIWQAHRAGGLREFGTLRLALQVFLPDAYRRLADTVAGLSGHVPVGEVEAVRRLVQA